MRLQSPAHEATLLLLSLLLPLALAGGVPPLSADPAPRDGEGVRLIVLVVVDQLIPEQLERLAPWLEGGLGRFARGEVWTEAYHGHAATETGPGHATLGTGVQPDRHGIVGNAWTDHASGRGQYCAGDSDARELGPEGPAADPGSASPVHLLAPGFAAHLRAADPDALAVGIAGKDRAAILTTGGEADWAFWWDARNGRGFVSSDAYGEALPEWVLEWDAAWAAGVHDLTWTLADVDHAAAGTASDARRGEPGGASGVFPHEVPSVSSPPTESELRLLGRAAYGSHLVDRFAVQLARHAVEELDLGGDAHPDFLFVGLSACDTVGHTFGPYSREVTQVLLAADRELETLFAALDERLGPGGWVGALSSDHGVLPLPEHLALQGLPARRVGTADLQRVAGELRAALRDVLGGDYLRGLSESEGHLDLARIAADGLEAEEVARFAVELLTQELPWVWRGLTRADLTAAGRAGSEADPLAALYARTFHPERSPDLYLVPRPWVLVTNQGVGTSHGSPWPYDRHVPVAFVGPGARPGKRFGPCQTVDVLPTLFARAGLPVPEGLDGKVLP